MSCRKKREKKFFLRNKNYQTLKLPLKKLISSRRQTKMFPTRIISFKSESCPKKPVMLARSFASVKIVFFFKS